MANSIGAYAQDGLNEIGAYEYVAPAGGTTPKSPLKGVAFFGPFAGPLCALLALFLLVG